MSPTMRASLAVVLGGAIWGLLWLPLRALGEVGLTGAWPGMVTYLAMAAIMAPVVWLLRGTAGGDWRMAAFGGVFTGTAFTCYAIALFYTDVVRVLLLFYMTPVWSTLLGLALLGERLSAARVLALIVGLLGLVVILGGGVGWPVPQNLGDWLSLAAGLAWSFGSLFLFRAGDVRVWQQMSFFVGGAIVISGAALVLGGPELGGRAEADLLIRAAPLAVITALVALPAMFLTLWPATMLSPARLGLLLMSEVLVGVASAAWLAGEPFGWVELAGSVLIVSAGVIEVMGRS